MNDARNAIRAIVIAGGLLLAFVVAGVALVALTYEHTLERIAENQRATLLRQLQTVVPARLHDNRPDQDVIMAESPALLGSVDPLPVYIARRDGEPVAAILTAVAPDGYSGEIRLLVGVLADGTVSGVRVIGHRETPGLGDAIERQRSNWILAFDSRSLGDPSPERWRVTRDNGVFDQITGATITSRAVVEAVRNALTYFETHRDALLGLPTETDDTDNDDETDGDAATEEGSPS